MKLLFKVKLNENHSAQPDQIKDGYLGNEFMIFKYTRKEALKKAIRFGGTIEQHKWPFLAKEVKMVQISNPSLLYDIEAALGGRECFTDNDASLGEGIYYGDVFGVMLQERIITGKAKFQLEELADYCIDYDYIQITK
jgi:hypothetical protein